MIRSFRSKPLRRFAETGDASKLPVQNPLRIGLLLGSLDAITRPEALNLPGYVSTGYMASRSVAR